MRTSHLWTAAALALALGACSRDARPRPNVILITLDTVRADHLSSYGYALPTTPNLDALAADGARFEQCASTAALTPVSHASILTGLNPYAHGLRVLHAASGFTLPRSVPSLASVLGDARYDTAAILSAFPVSEVFGLDQGFDTFDNGLPEGVSQRRAEQRAGGEGGRTGEGGGKRGRDAPQAATQRRSDATTDAVLRWLDRARDPFFLWIHYWDPHDPILVPPPQSVRAFRESTGASEYAVELHYVDQQIGRLFERLRADGLYDDALIVVTADHGEGLGEHDWHAHRLLYEEQLHVPLIVKLPKAKRGVVVKDLVRTIDIYPTALEVAGVDSPRPYEGASLVDLALGGPAEPRVAYADQLNKWDTQADMLVQRPDDDLLHSMRDGNWKLIYRPLRPDASELYDLAADPDEVRNRFRDEGERARALLGMLEARKPFVLEGFGAASLEGDAADALRELGYLGGD